MEKDYSQEALSIIAYLNLKYWCETNEEKRYYRDMYLNKDNNKFKFIVIFLSSIIIFILT